MKSAIMDATRNYNSTNFIDQRPTLESSIIQYVQTVFDQKTLYLVRIKSIYITKMEFAKEYEDALTININSLVDTNISELDKNASISNATINKNYLVNDAQIYLNLADTQAYQKAQIKAVQGQSLNILISTDASSHKNIDDVFNFSSDNTLINFILSIEQGNFAGSQLVNYNNAEISVK